MSQGYVGYDIQNALRAELLSLGISKPVIKAHGSSDAKAFFGAFRQAKLFVERNAVDEMTKAIASLSIGEELENG